MECLWADLLLQDPQKQTINHLPGEQGGQEIMGPSSNHTGTISFEIHYRIPLHTANLAKVESEILCVTCKTDIPWLHPQMFPKFSK